MCYVKYAQAISHFTLILIYFLIFILSCIASGAIFMWLAVQLCWNKVTVGNSSYKILQKCKWLSYGPLVTTVLLLKGWQMMWVMVPLICPQLRIVTGDGMWRLWWPTLHKIGVNSCGFALTWYICLVLDITAQDRAIIQVILSSRWPETSSFIIINIYNLYWSLSMHKWLLVRANLKFSNLNYFQFFIVFCVVYFSFSFLFLLVSMQI